MNNTLPPIIGAIAGGLIGPDSVYISLGAVTGSIIVIWKLSRAIQRYEDRLEILENVIESLPCFGGKKCMEIKKQMRNILGPQHD